MPVNRKTEVVSLRTTKAFKRALKLAAAKEHRSQANFLERIVLEYCDEHSLNYNKADRRGAK